MPQEVGGSVTDALMAMDVASGETMDRLRGSGIQPTDRTICLGDVTTEDLRSFEDVSIFCRGTDRGILFQWAAKVGGAVPTASSP